MVNIKTFHAVGDGVADDTAAIQAALDSSEREIEIPEGKYRTTATLRIPSHKHIRASEKARMIFLPDRPLTQKDFLLSNADTVNGNEDITVEGGIWDGGLGGTYNVKSHLLFEPDSCSGACLNFVRVKHLKLLDLTVANPIAFYVRMGMLQDFEIKNIGFFSEKKSRNQDGLHFGGQVYNGVVENVRALTPGQTNDDMIAVNADDSTVRADNRDLICGPIENIVFRNIYADDCYSLVRLASVTSPIRNITFENLYAGCRCFAINMDGLRYCRTPMFRDEEAPEGVGFIQNVTFRGLRVFFSESGHGTRGLIGAESNADGFRISGFERVMEKDKQPETPTLLARNVARNQIIVDGNDPVLLTDKSMSYEIPGDFSELTIDAIK